MKVKVQTSRRRLGAPALVFALVLAACGGGEAPEAPDAEASPEAAVAPVDARFGDPYEIVLGRSPADPDVPPALVGDTLVALVAYAGGCEDHAFSLRDETARDTLRLWIAHDANGDDCEAYLHDEVRLLAPRAARDAATVVLLNPHDAVPFTVGRAAE